MLRLPSLTYIVEHAHQALRRFPFVFACSFLSAGVAITLIQRESSNFEFIRLFMTLGLGIPFFFSLSMYLEKPIPSVRPPSGLFMAAGTVALVGFYFLSGHGATSNFYLSFALWSLALHLLAAFSPFLAAGETRGFWQFNRRLFLRFLLSLLYAAVFYLGLVIALVAINNLLGVKISEKLYLQLWVFSAFVLMTWHFLAAVPKELSILDNDVSYPGGLKVFTQFLLVPLVTLYLLILYIYLAKILLTAKWPTGTVTWLVSGVAVFGVLNLLLLEPVREKTPNNWVRLFARGFYLALFPLLAMLFTAVGKRIGQYGITEFRYLVAVLGIWILCIALYFLIHRNPSIKTVPVTLFVLIVVTSFGPWSPYSISRNSQLGRLKAVLIKDGMWNGTRAVKSRNAIPLQDRKEISSVLDYFVESHGVMTLQSLFDEDLTRLKDRKNSWDHDLSAQVCKLLGFEYVNKWGGMDLGKYFYYNASTNDDVLALNGYDWMVFIGSKSKFNLNGKEYDATTIKGILTITSSGEPDLIFDLSKLQNSLKDFSKSDSAAVPASRLGLAASNQNWAGYLMLKTFSGYLKDDGLEVSSFEPTLLLKRLK